MPFPTGTYIDQIRGALSYVADEFEQLYSLFKGYLSQEHNSSGGHTAVTAESLDASGDVTIGGDLDVTGTSTLGGVIIGEVITVPTTGTTGPGVSIPNGGDASTNSWAILVDNDNYADSIGFYDTTDNREVVKLYHTGVGTYQLCPSEDGLSTVDLGGTTTALKWNDINAKGTITGVTISGTTGVLGSVYSVSGLVAAVAATPTTVFSASAVGMYQVFTYVGSGAGSTYVASATVLSDGTGVRITANNGADMTLTLSGSNVQVTLTSGANVQYRYLKIA